jgi:hypothetical protein
MSSKEDTKTGGDSKATEGAATGDKKDKSEAP